MSAPPVPAKAGAMRWLALGAVAGPVLFTLAWLVLGFLSPGYVLLDTQIAPHAGILLPVSALATGPTGPFMSAAFVLSGLLLLLGVIGVFHGIREMDANARWSCILLLALSPLGAVAAGLATPRTLSLYAGGFALGVHAEGVLLAVASPVPSFLIVGLLLRSVPRWRRLGAWLLWGSPLTLALLILFLATFNPLAIGGATQPLMLLRLGGLTERALFLASEAWFVALGWAAFARSPGQPNPP
jgi:hypothetical protein